MKLYNTLTNEKQEFSPLNKNELKMYVCGVTVYAPLHLGHIRTYIAYDVMAEYFEVFKNLKVFYVRNITDVGSVVGDADEGEDKIELKASEKKLHPLELCDQNILGMWQGLDAVFCRRPNISPRATGFVTDIIEAVKKLIESKNAYELDGNVYLDVSTIKGYGMLSGNTIEKLSAGKRIEADPRKHTPFDFAIWKKAQPKSVLKWNSPWGLGYPGWHIECSVMSQKLLGEQFDIHGGGRELQFPHHENEIAQSIGLFGKIPANFWVHTGMLNAPDGTKMSKSKGNYITVEEALKTFGARNLRYLCAFSHYRSPLAFSNELFKQIEAERKKVENFVLGLEKAEKHSHSKVLDDLLLELKQKFEEAMDDDFSSPNALTELFEFLKKANPIVVNGELDEQNATEIKQFFEKVNKVFKAFEFEQKQPEDDEKAIKELVEKRNKFREEKNFEKADEIKKQIFDLGYEIFDSKTGTTFKKK